MLRNIIANRVAGGMFGLAALFFGLVGFTNPESLIIVLNGIFAGCMVAIVVAYHRLIVGAALGLGEYNRVRQMTMGFAVGWIAICLSTTSSIYARSEGAPLTAPTLTAAVRYLFILAAILQITAPDFGLGLFHGRDRKTLWLGFVMGMVTAIATIIFQDRTLLF
jgi:hypothetical protein